jgi:hypothetical protein
MRLLPRRLLPALCLALAMATGAHAQSRGETVQLPVWNQASGKVEAVLLLEPTDFASAGIRRRFSEGALEATFGVGAGDSLGLLCDRKSGVSSAIASLVNHCLLASLGDDNGPASRRFNAATSFTRGTGKVGLALGNGQDSLPAWLSPTGRSGKVEQTDLTVVGQKNLGREGFVSIGGTVAKAKLVTAADAPDLADRWNTRSLTLGGGYGPFSGNIVGRVTNVPARPANGAASAWASLGAPRGAASSPSAPTMSSPVARTPSRRPRATTTRAPCRMCGTSRTCKPIFCRDGTRSVVNHRNDPNVPRFSERSP